MIGAKLSLLVLLSICLAPSSQAATFNLAGTLVDGQSASLELSLANDKPDFVDGNYFEWDGVASITVGDLSISGLGALAVFDDELVDGQVLDSIQFAIYETFDLPFDGDVLDVRIFQGGFRIDPTILPEASLAGVAAISGLLSDAATNGGFWTVIGFDTSFNFVESRGPGQGEITSFSANASPVPLPATAWLFLSVVGGMGAWRRLRA